MKLQKPLSKFNPVYVWLVIILVIAAILRFYHYAGFSFSNDELSAINRLRFGTFRELVDRGFYVDGHPGGIQVMLWYWVKLFGISEASLRLPFVVFGILAVLFAFLTGRQLFGAVCGLFTAAAVAFLEFPLLYSQIARPYGSGVFFCLLMVWFWYRVINQENTLLNKRKHRIVNLAGYAIAAALCMYNHYFSFLLAAVVGITGLFLVSRKNITGYIMAGTAACVMFLPHLYITLNHLTYRGVGLWLGKPSPSWIIGHIIYIFNNQFWLALIALLTALSLAYLNRKSIRFNRNRLIVLLFFLFPLITGYVYSIAVNPVLQHPVLIFSFVFLLLFIFSFSGDQFRPVHSVVLSVFLLAGVCSTVVVGDYYHKQHFGEFKDVARRIIKAGNTYGKNKVTNLVSTNNPYYITYYFDRQKDSSFLAMTEVTPDSLLSLGKKVRSCGTPYLLYAWTKPSPPEANDIISATYPYRIEFIDYGGLSQLGIYAKINPGSYVESSEVIAEKQITFEENPSVIGSEKLRKDFAFGGNTSMQVDTTVEYCPAITINLKDHEEYRGQHEVASEAWVWFDQQPEDAILVLSLESPGKDPVIWKGALVKYFADAGRWSKVLQTFTLPEGVDSSAVLKSYVWNKGRESFMVDEMRLSIRNCKQIPADNKKNKLPI